MKPYQMRILSCSDPAQFNKLLQEFMDYGWKPYGEMHTTPDSDIVRLLITRSWIRAKLHGDMKD